MPSTTDITLYSLAGRARPQDPGPNTPGLPGNWQAIEAPFLIRHGGYFYLFLSYDLCCRGTKSTYRTMVGRAKKVTGPYVDRDGVPMLKGGATELLKGNDAWFGPGGESVARGAHGEDLLVYHAYDHAAGRPALQISPIVWKAGWPQVVLADP